MIFSKGSGQKKGFTLIELILALGVFTVGIIAAMTLVMADANRAQENMDNVLAANLAKESLDLVRNIRDSNWLRIDANDTGSCNLGSLCSWDYGLNQSNYIYLDYLDSQKTPNDLLTENAFNCLGSESIATCLSNCGGNCRLYRNTDGFYSHDNTGFPTTVYRIIRLKRICFDPTETDATKREYERNMTGACDINDEYIGIEATAYLEWTRGQIHSLQFSERLYNWR